MDSKIDASKIQEIQILEQNLQNLMAQKQASQFELNETNNALEEVKKTKSDAYRILGNIMIKSKPEDLVKELEEKKKILDLRISSIEKQEKLIGEKHLALREEINSVLTKNKPGSSS